MASRRNLDQEDTRLRVLRLLSENPDLSTRQIAKSINISHGSAYYLVHALIEKGFVKLGNFARNRHKRHYAYLLTQSGLREKANLTRGFIFRKRAEFKELQAELEAFERELAEGKNV